MNQDEFFQAHAVDGVLSDEHMAQLLQLPEGDSGQQPQSGPPDPAPTPTPEPTQAPVVPTPTPEPVILAKDGVHTIGYEKLVEAREAEKAAKAEAEALRAQLEAAKAAPAASAEPKPAEAAPATPTTGLEDVDFGDFSDEALKKGVLEAIDKRVAQLLPAKVAEALAPLERRAQEQAIRDHATALYTAHPQLDAMLESKELESWITSHPSYAQPALRAVLDAGTTAQVIELFDNFVKATGTGKTAAAPAAPEPVKADVVAKAKAAIDAAKPSAPASLSEIPGAAVQHDAAEAMLDMSPTAMMTAFAGKSKEQIDAILNRLV